MKNIARVALTPGLEIGADVYNYKNELVVCAGTKVDGSVINKLGRHSIVCVPIKEDIDYAVTHFEKIRLSKGFQTFRDTYQSVMPKYRDMMRNLAFVGIPFEMDELMQIYYDISGSLDNPEYLLDYLYNMLPTEDDFTYAHCLNSALIAGLFASWFSLPEDKTTLLIQCGFLYDIGKLQLPNSLIWKPGKLTDIEFEQVKSHTFLSFKMLQNLPVDSCVIKAALMHHERFDGSGYPSRLHDTQIDLYARYISIIDAYEAMTSARTYRESKNPFQVIDIFEQDAFKYDTELLGPILYRLASHMIGLNVMLNNDQIAEVIMVTQGHLGRPLLRDEEGNFIDLMARRDLSIKGIY